MPSARCWRGTGSPPGTRTGPASVDFDALPDPERHPLLLIGAVDVLSGAFKAFSSGRDRLSVETILASAAIPTLFRCVHLDGGT